MQTPLLQISGNEITGVSQTTREPMFENEMTKAAGLIATCNSCDRVIFEDENFRKEFIANGGYCKECATDFL